MSKKYTLILLLIVFVTFLTNCTKTNEGTDEATPVMTGTPVTVTSVSTGTLKETVKLNAISAFQLKTSIKATTTGYLESVNARLGGYINKGQEIFVVKTKEAQVLDNTISSLDSSFNFNGTVHIKSPGSGYVTMLNYKSGDYVQDGEQLAAISDKSSFVFLLNLPFELTPYLDLNKNIDLRLPDGVMVDGKIISSMPTVDAASQTQSIVIKSGTDRSIPEGLIAKALFIKRTKSNVTTLPREAVLTNDIQSDFWVMKLINDTTAVKVLIEKGMENNDQVEILSPEFSDLDRILLTGNYGLPDTAKVLVIKSNR